MRKIALIFGILLAVLDSRASIGIINGLSHELTGAPGEVIQGYIEVANLGKMSERVTLSASDYSFQSSGEIDYPEAGSLKRSNAEWITISPAFADLAPKEKVRFMFEVRIPDDDTLRGSYWSVFMVEGSAPLDTNVLRGMLTMVNRLRYAVQVVTTIGQTGLRELLFTGVGVHREDSLTLLHIDIANPGERLLKPILSAEIFDTGGQSLGTFQTAIKRLYPGTSSRFTLELPRLPKASYQALLVADCKEEDIFGTTISFEITDD